VIGLLGIAVGVVGLRLLQVSKLPIRSPLFGLGGRPGGGSGPDSPIVVSGGSVNSHSDEVWTAFPTNSNAYGTDLLVNGTKVPANKLDLDGFDPDTTTFPQHIKTIQPPGNWIVTLYFRKTNASTEDPATTLKICSRIDSALPHTCQVDNGPVNSSVYLLAEDSKGNPIGTFLTQKIDRYGVFFDLSKCDSASADPHAYCNHIYSAQVQTSQGTSQKYHCVDGACSVGISNQ